MKSKFQLGWVLLVLSLLPLSSFSSDWTSQLSISAIKSVLGGAETGRRTKTQATRDIAVSVDLPASTGNFDKCANLFPAGKAINLADVDVKWIPYALCSQSFAVLYSGLTKTPLVVVERLNKGQMSKATGVSRTDEFYPDPRLPGNERAELEDYRNSGFDRGHQSPAADQPDYTSMAQSFSLSNIVPQNPFHNQKTWSKVESDVRKYVRRAAGNVYVFTGPVFEGRKRTVGANHVWVPSSIFKLVYDQSTGRSWAYVLDNSAEARVEKPMDYASFVKVTGWNLLSN